MDLFGRGRKTNMLLEQQGTILSLQNPSGQKKDNFIFFVLEQKRSFY